MSGRSPVMLLVLALALVACGSTTPGSVPPSVGATTAAPVASETPPSSPLSAGSPARSLTPSTVPAVFGPVPASTLDAATSAALHAILDATVRDRNVPGVAAAVITRDGTWAGVAGVADPATAALLQPDSAFAIGSITKTIVAALVLRQVEAGTMGLDDALAAHLPTELAGVTNGATIREALGHRSGIAEHVDDEFLGRVLANCARAWRPDEVAAEIGDSTAGRVRHFEYSNSNYILLGIALQRRTGRTIGTLTRELLDPLGLTRIVFQPEAAPPPPLALPHIDLDADGEWDRLETAGLLPCRGISTVAWTAGGYAADAGSLARWGWLLYGGSVLEPASLAAMTDTRDDGYGLGTFAASLGTTESIGHDGGIPGYVSRLFAFPAEGIVIAVLVNADRGELIDFTAARLLGAARR